MVVHICFLIEYKFDKCDKVLQPNTPINLVMITASTSTSLSLQTLRLIIPIF